MSRLQSFLLLALLLSIGGLTTSTPASAQQQSSAASDTISVALPDTSGAVGDQVNIPIVTGDLTGKDIVGYQFEVTYDGSVLDVTGVNTTGTLTSGSVTVNTSDPDTITVVFASTEKLSGSGVLLELEAEVVGSGTSPLSFVYFEYEDDAAQEVPSNTSDGTFAAKAGAPSAPTNLTATVSGTSIDLTWSGVGATDLQRYRLYRSTAPIDPSDEGSPIDSVEAGNTTYTDDTAEPGHTYYYRVSAVDSTGLESSLSTEASAFLYPQEITVAVNRTFGGASEAGDYRLVALPGRVDRSLSEAISGRDGTDWQAFWDDGSAEGFLQKFDGSETFTFRPGRGFWLTHIDGWTLDEAVPTVVLRGDSSAVIDLHDGWNVISNPTGKNVAWSHVASENGGTLQPLWAFDGSFTQADSFRSAKAGLAYYFHNDGGLDSLSVPYPGSPAETTEKRGAKQGDRRTTEPQVVTLSAKLISGGPPSGQPASSVRIGTAPAARKGKDPLDVLAPPSRFSKVALQLRAPKAARKQGLPARQRRWARDVRPTGTKGSRYGLLLRGKPGTTVRLSAEGLEAFSERRAALLDSSRGTSYDLRPGGAVELTLRDSSSVLQLVLGSGTYVQSQKAAVRPGEVTLTSYPNPLRQRATLVYTLPEKTDVRLAIYDVLGRRVTVLADGRRPAGRHRVQLKASQLSELSSGVYFARLRAAEKTLTRKITVVR